MANRKAHASEQMSSGTAACMNSFGGIKDATLVVSVSCIFEMRSSMRPPIYGHWLCAHLQVCLIFLLEVSRQSLQCPQRYARQSHDASTCFLPRGAKAQVSKVLSPADRKRSCRLASLYMPCHDIPNDFCTCKSTLLPSYCHRISLSRSHLLHGGRFSSLTSLPHSSEEWSSASPM